MKNLYYCNSTNGCKSRLVENLRLCENIRVQEENNNINIYKHFLMGIKNFIIPIDSIDNNAVNFVQDHGDECQVYIDITNSSSSPEHLKGLGKIVYLCNTAYDYEQQNHIDVSEFVNYSLFNSYSCQEKKNILAVFLNNSTKVPDSIEKKLQKNNLKFQVRLFDNKNIKHDYNVGLVSEKEKTEILNTYKYYIAINDNYINEAKICGAILLDPETFKPMNIDKKHQPIAHFIDRYLV